MSGEFTEDSPLSPIPNSIWNPIALSHIQLPVCHARGTYLTQLLLAGRGGGVSLDMERERTRQPEQEVTL